MHIGGACLVMIRLLASRVQSFLLMAVEFSLAFLYSSISPHPEQLIPICSVAVAECSKEKRLLVLTSLLLLEFVFKYLLFLFGSVLSGPRVSKVKEFH